VTKKSFDHRQLLVAPTGKFILDEAHTHLDAAGIIKIIMSVVVAFTAKLGVCTSRHARISPKLGFDFDKQTWPRNMTHDLFKLRFPQFHVGWRA
jgi:hypothetical protein